MRISAVTTALIVAVLLGPLSFAEVYKVVDANGNVTYTDQPQPNAQLAPLALPPVNKIPSAEPLLDTLVDPQAMEEAQPLGSFAGYSQARILAPVQDAIIPNQQRKLIIQLQLTPQLQPEHRVQFYKNGRPLGSPVTALVYELDNLERGTYQLGAQVQTGTGRLLVSVPPVDIHVQRHFRRN